MELVKGVEGALSLHVQLEAPPQDTGDAPPVDFESSLSNGSSSFSHLRTLAERVAQVRHLSVAVWYPMHALATLVISSASEWPIS